MSDGRIRVLFVSPTLRAGGAERVTTTLIKNISLAKFDVTVAVVNNNGAPWIPEQEPLYTSELPTGISLIDLKAPRLRKALPAIVRLIWRVRPNIVFSTCDHINAALGATRRLWPPSTRFIVRPTVLFSAAAKSRRSSRLWHFISKLTAFNADLTVFQSPEMEQDYRNALRFGGAAAVIRNPIDFSFSCDRSASQVADTSYSPDAFNLVAAGRLVPQKGFDIAIEAMALTRNKDVTLTILGHGPLREQLEHLVRERQLGSRIRLLGFVRNPYPYYAQASGFLLSSRFEGFPNVVLEALSCGTPVVATPVPGLASVLKQIPQCQLSLDFTPISLAGAIDRLVNQGRQRVLPESLEDFDVRHVAPMYEKVFTNIRLQQHAL